MEKFIEGFEKKAMVARATTKSTIKRTGGLIDRIKEFFGAAKKQPKAPDTRPSPPPSWDPYARTMNVKKKKKSTAVRSKPKPGPTIDYSSGSPVLVK